MTVILALTTGCGQDSGELEILCGNSFRLPMEKLAEMYEKETGKHVEMSFAGSEALLSQVMLKAAGDVFVTHAPYQEDTKEAGALLREVEVGFQDPVLVVRKGNPKNVTRIEDLAKEGLQVVLTDPEYSTCGEMVYALLEKKGIKEAVLKNVGDDLVRNHSDVGNQLKDGIRDAGIMWNGVAHGYLDAIEIVPGPYEYDEPTRLSVMGLSYSKKQEELGKFLDFVEKHGKQVFSDFGYVKGGAEDQE
jgi:molybdate transport system substrate-binding protein